MEPFIGLKSSNDIPWLVIGDFNEVLSWSKKWGGQDRSKHQIAAFRHMLVGCNLSDLDFSG